MNTLVDIQMPIKKGGFIVGDVVQRLLNQDVSLTFYIDASDDFNFPSGYEEMLKLTAVSTEDEARIRKSLSVAFKRNKMRRLGTSPYVYLADPDLLLPDEPVLGSMVRGLERHPRLGAVGVPCQRDNHVSAASMMLRRKHLLRVGEFRGSGCSCICNYISNQLLKFGLYTVPLKTVKATHLKAEYDKEYSSQQSKYSEYVKMDGRDVLSLFDKEQIRGILDREKLKKKLAEIRCHPCTNFKLFFPMPT